MGVFEQLQKLHLLKSDAQQQEVSGNRLISLEARGEARIALECQPRIRPGPDRACGWAEFTPVAGPLAAQQLDRQLGLPAAQTELAAGPWQQPQQFHGGLPSQFGGLGAATIAEQIQAGSRCPAAEHQRSHPWGSIESNGGHLQPSRLG